MTPRQLFLSKGFKQLPQKHQTSYRFVYYGIVKDGVVQARAGIETQEYERNPTSVVVYVGEKPRYISAEYKKSWGMERLSPEQMQRLEKLLDEAIAAGPVAPKEKKPRPPAHNKGKTLSNAEKMDNRVWRHLGYLTCVGFVDKDMQERLYYIKAGKFIRVEDLDSVMAYANIRDEDLEAVGMTVELLEKWLISKGVKRKPNPRAKPFFSLYD